MTAEYVQLKKGKKPFGQLCSGTATQDAPSAIGFAGVTVVTEEKFSRSRWRFIARYNYVERLGTRSKMPVRPTNNCEISSSCFNITRELALDGYRRFQTASPLNSTTRSR